MSSMSAKSADFDEFEEGREEDHQFPFIYEHKRKEDILNKEVIVDMSRSQLNEKIKPALKKDMVFRELFPLENSD
jgi:hypothetical protein